jgi:nucleotide-binding universal stress UspA family protein
VAIAVAAAGLRTESDSAIEAIAVADGQDDAAAETARALADRLGARLVGPESESADLIVVGSQPGAPAGRIALSGATRSMLNSARGSVLVVPRGKPLSF